MTEQSAAALKRSESGAGLLHFPENPASCEEYATLMLDRRGRILNCCDSAEKIFGLSQTRLIGRWAAEFIAGLPRAGGSPSFVGRYLASLCTDSQWRQFDGKDAAGRELALELHLSQMMTGGQEGFLLTVRQLEPATGARHAAFLRSSEPDPRTGQLTSAQADVVRAASLF